MRLAAANALANCAAFSHLLATSVEGDLRQKKRRNLGLVCFLLLNAGERYWYGSNLGQWIGLMEHLKKTQGFTRTCYAATTCINIHDHHVSITISWVSGTAEPDGIKWTTAIRSMVEFWMNHLSRSHVFYPNMIQQCPLPLHTSKLHSFELGSSNGNEVRSHRINRTIRHSNLFILFQHSIDKYNKNPWTFATNIKHTIQKHLSIAIW